MEPESNEERIEIEFERNFDTLLFDSIELLFQSLDSGVDYDFGQTLARGAMLNCTLLLELAANICIESLDFDRQIFKEIDRLPMVAKFDLYLRIKFRNKKLDRGEKRYQAIGELKRLRDTYVHMKPHRLEWKITGDRGVAELDRTPILDIPKNPSGWDQESAIKAMSAVHAFIKYYFKSKCRYSKKQIGALLLSKDAIPGGENYPRPLFSKSTTADLKAMGIDIGYINLYLSDL